MADIFDNHVEKMQTIQNSIDELNRRMQFDSNDLDYETHLRQKRQLEQILYKIKASFQNKVMKDS